MNNITIKKLTLSSNSIPKICVPIMGQTTSEIVDNINNAILHKADLLELRIDNFTKYLDLKCIIEMLSAIKHSTKNIPVIFTFRTKKEGGTQEISDEYYHLLLKTAILSGSIDIIDVEISSNENTVNSIINEAQNNNVLVIGSYHNFHNTPNISELLDKFKEIDSNNCDVLKIAVTPVSNEDVLTLMLATAKYNNICNKVVISMSMGQLGYPSRITGSLFGSVVTFATAGKSSAPGQIPIEQVREALLHF